jgi:hypothetical protein
LIPWVGKPGKLKIARLAQEQGDTFGRLDFQRGAITTLHHRGEDVPNFPEADNSTSESPLMHAGKSDRRSERNAV